MSQSTASTVHRLARRQSITLAALLLCAGSAFGAVPPAEKLLPPDTLLVLSAPDWTQLQAAYRKSAQRQFWEDPAMNLFREKLLTKWNEEFVQPLERDLGVKLGDYSALLQGQVTLAVTQGEWQGNGKNDGLPAFLFLLDARDQSGLLKTNLTELRKKWNDAGKPIKTEKIRDVEFSVIPLTTNDVPPTLKQFVPQPQKVEELGQENEPPAPPTELVVGQYDSLLIVGSSLKAVTDVVLRLAGSAAPTLDELPEFASSRTALFREAPLYGWLNAKTFFAVLTRMLASQENNEAPSPLPIPAVGKLIAASGLGGLKSVAFDFRDSGDGHRYEMFVAAPEASRTGLAKLLTLAPKDCTPPAFVPADVVKFQRIRLDGQQAIKTIEKMLGDISAEALNTWNFLLSNGNEAVRVKEPDYDIRKNLFGNLGDDFITYEKLPRGDSALELASPPSLFLIGSPNPDQLAAALKGVLIILTPEGGNPKSREFLGRKIFTIKLPPLPIGGSPSAGRTLNYAASAGYVAFSTDIATLEEFLRSSEGQNKPLRDVPGLAQAIARIGGQSTGWLTYENESETMRLQFAALRRSAGATNNAGPSVLTSTIPFAAPEKKIRDWLDFSLLPDYDKVAKYFSFDVYTGSASVDGLTFKFYSPLPPQLKP